MWGSCENHTTCSVHHPLWSMTSPAQLVCWTSTVRSSQILPTAMSTIRTFERLESTWRRLWQYNSNGPTGYCVDNKNAMILAARKSHRLRLPRRWMQRSCGHEPWRIPSCRRARDLFRHRERSFRRAGHRPSCHCSRRPVRPRKKKIRCGRWSRRRQPCRSRHLPWSWSCGASCRERACRACQASARALVVPASSFRLPGWVLCRQ